MRSSIPLFLSFTSACATAQMAPVYLSHVYVVIDPASYDAIRRSDEMGALASTGERTLGEGRDRWAAFFIAGRQTAIEILAATTGDGGGERRLGQCGIGLGSADAGDIAGIEKRLRAVLGARVRLESNTRNTPAGTIPWFTEIEVEGNDSDFLSTWFAVSSPGYIVAKHPARRSGPSLSRDEFLAANFLPDHMLDDVVGLTVALSPPESLVLASELKVAGWVMRQLDETTFMTGPDAAIAIVPAGAQAGIREVKLRLRHSCPRRQTQLGKAELLVEGNAGRLVFWGRN